MKKNALLEVWLEKWETNQMTKLPAGTRNSLPREYRAYFFCFNHAQYYEAHDVLEHLWLLCHDSNRSFYQALIQFAGAFVHFQKQALFPEHPTHSRRLAPGRRLLALAASRLKEYPLKHERLDLGHLLELCQLWQERSSSHERPLSAFPPPILALESESSL